jgi:hypothetical protein
VTTRLLLVSIVALALSASVCARRESPAPVRLRVDGRYFVAGDRTFRPLFASGLVLLTRTGSDRAVFLDDVKAIGFNGIRVFAGALEWAKQTPLSARRALPALLDEAGRRGLYVEVTAITDSRTGYDVESHLRQISAICAAAPNCILEAANEFYHHTQSDLVQDSARLFALGQRAVRGTIWALGAPPSDALPPGGTWPVPSADFITLHLARSDPFWTQLARVREMARVSAATGKPVINNEPIGAAEESRPGRREADPRFFFALGALSRLFEIGVIFHSEDGLHGRRFGPNQRRCAEEFVAGFNSVPTEARLAGTEIGSAGSPVTDVRNVEAAHLASDGQRWWVVLIGVEGEPSISRRDARSSAIVIARREGIRIVEVRR